jgi:pimeloyl-ACP methyl ester carboxylesterase
MQLDLVSIETDTHPLTGLFYLPTSRRPLGAALFMHGNCMNFYTGPARFIPPALAWAGYACLAFNRRGHDVIATLNSRQAVGGAFQLVDEAIADNRFAAEWLAARGFARPIVVGHSNGGVLGVHHVAHHPDTPALVLLSAHVGGTQIVPLASKVGLLGGDRLDDLLAQARAMVAAGRGNELMLLPGWWYAVTAASFLDYASNIPDTLALAPRITCPVLYLRGDQEPPHIYPAEAFAARTGGPCEVHVVPDCDHFYGGREEAVRSLMTGWLEGVLAEGMN